MAEKDLGITLEDAENGFGMPATVTDPAGNVASLNVQSGDVHLLYDSGTDAKINNRTAHISMRISSLEAAGLAIPRAQPNQNLNPWRFEFADATGKIRKFMVSDVMPDRTLGVVTVIIEFIK